MSRFVITATWDDVPHLSETVKRELWDSIPPWQRDSRTRGVPSLGAGAIYPIPEDTFVVDPFAIPPHWTRAYGMDVGWRNTATVWVATNPDTRVHYLYDAYKRGESEPSVHAAAIRARGAWIPGVIDPASRGRSQKDGLSLIEIYRDTYGLLLETANHAVEAGLYAVWTLLSHGQLKVFRHCGGWLEEFRLYRRDEDGKIVKDNDHYMDATRYWAMSGRDLALPVPGPPPEPELRSYDASSVSLSWMG
jgi:Terminase RNaseH-like domain